MNATDATDADPVPRQETASQPIVPENSACAATATDQPTVVQDATGARFVLVPEARYRALEAAARSTPAQQPVRVSLTVREQQVLQLIADGCPGAVVADRLGLATNTVVQHLVAVRRKYGVRSSKTAATFARRDGLIT